LPAERIFCFVEDPHLYHLSRGDMTHARGADPSPIPAALLSTELLLYSWFQTLYTPRR
jgi:hypothetical protein